MKCYNHHDRDAFGISYHSNKGLCLECMEIYKDCVIEKGDDLAKQIIDGVLNTFKNIKTSDKLTENSRKLIDDAISARKFSYYLFLSIGIINIFIGILDSFSIHSKLAIPILISGVFFFVLSFAYKKYLK